MCDPDEYALVQLANGVWSVHSPREAETFHPVVGPVAEAEALYVRQLRLRERLALGESEFVLWDVGLGAAGNVLAVLRATHDLPCPLRVVSFDRSLAPLRFGFDQRERLGYFGPAESWIPTLLAQGHVAFKNGAQPVAWETQIADFPTLLASAAGDALPKPHAIMYDAFSPATNPDMWTLPLFTRLFRLLDSSRPCALPTYSRSTLLRVTLLLAGFFVGVGHATGEKEETTVAANRLALLDEPLDRRWLARARRSNSAEPLSAPVYRQARLSADSRERLERHPQFAG